MRLGLHWAIWCLLLSIGSGNLFAATFTVLNTNNSNAGSLRQAILDANGTPGVDIIDFNIPMVDPGYVAGPPDYWSIQPTTALPAITEQVTIDGYTQPGASANTTSAPTTLDTLIKIELNGTNAGAGADGLTVTGNTVTIRGLVINNFNDDAIVLSNSNNHVITGNFIGTNINGTTTQGNNTGILIASSDNITIGGNTSAETNIISGNGNHGIIANTDALGVTIQGNLIGTDNTRTGALGNTNNGIFFTGDAGNLTLGGTTSAERNVIAHNTSRGFGVNGDRVDQRVLGNSIFSNGSIGIDINNNGVSANTPGGGDNDNPLNYPVITSIVDGGAGTIFVNFDLDLSADDYRVEFFLNTVADPSGFGEGETFITFTNINHTGSGVESFSHSFAGSVGDIISTTNTRCSNPTCTLFFRTSEFSQTGAAVPLSIAGNISEDVNGDGNMADATAFNNVTVELFLDDGDNTPDAGDTSQGTTTTNASGDYAFSSLSNGAYWVVVDSRSLDAPAGYNSGNLTNIWGEQTYAVNGRCDNYSNGGQTQNSGAATCFGGLNAEVSDNYTGGSIVNAEHVSQVVLSNSVATGIDFGFAFNVISNSRDVDDDGVNPRFGQGSLRQFILNGNAVTTNLSSNFEVPLNASDPGFNAANGGYISILPNSDLNALTDTITLDAYTQSGASANTQAYPSALDGILKIELNGSNGISDGLLVQADSSTVRGLVINNFDDDGIELQSNSNSIEGNYLGTNITGLAAASNDFGLNINQSDGNTIGGTAAAQRNLISGNSSDAGLEINSSINNLVQGNFIGTDATGIAGLPNASDGIFINSSGGAPSAANNQIGGTASTAGNRIAFNVADGVFLRNDVASANTVIGNSIYSNGTLGIDMSLLAGSDGVSENDGGDGDSGPNDLLNFPVMTFAGENAGTVNVNFDLDVAAGDYRIEFFTNPSGTDPSGNGEGEIFAGFVNINHTGSGVESFNTSFAGASGDVLTATATECTTSACADWDSTSEFSDTFTVAAVSAFNISGNVSEDVNGDGNMADAVAFNTATVEVFLDDGDNTPDAGDTSQGTTTTDASGNYSFTGLINTQTYWIVVDSKTLDASAGYNAGDLTNIWGEQTHGTAGAQCDNYTDGGINTLGATGACFGGINAEVSDAYATGVVTNAEHATRITLAGANATNVNFGFAFNVISNSRDVDDDGVNPRFGQGSLRQFILNGNAITTNLSSNFEVPLNASDSGFNAANGGYISIQPSSDLDAITDTVTLDAYTQTGAVANTQDYPNGLNTVLKIELDGASATDDGFNIQANASTIRGFAINNYGDDGIELQSDSNVVEGNFIGTDITGLVDAGNGIGIFLLDSDNNTIGGTAAARNLISGNDASGGMQIDGSAGNQIQGNFIGPNAAGAAGIGNALDGIYFYVAGSSGNQVGGSVVTSGNLIAFNGADGVFFRSNAGTNNTVIGNSIHSNGTLGIDISTTAISDGVTENDAGDIDSGPNDFMNFPVITSAAESGGIITVNFDVDTAAGNYRIEFFDNTAADASGNGEGETFAGFVNIAHTGSGVESFNTSFAGIVGDILTGTMTECTDGTCTDWNSTSEFSDGFTATSAAAFNISGNVSEDVDGDGSMADAQASNAVTVELFLDDGDNTPDAGDVSQGTTTTDASGNYSFTGLANGTYWTVVDSKTVPPFNGFEVGSVQADIWAEQTFGSAGAQCDNYTDGGINTLGADGTCYGGINAEVSDAYAAGMITNAEHATRVTIAGATVNNVNFGFTFNAITQTRDGDDDGANARSIQGSLGQFIQNSNAIQTIQSSIFNLPVSDPGYVAGPPDYWSIQPVGDSIQDILQPAIIDASTQPGSVANSNLPPQSLNTVLKVELNGVNLGGASFGFFVAPTAGGITIRGFAINNFPGDGIVFNSGDTHRVEGNFIGTNIDGTVAQGNGGEAIHMVNLVGASNNIGALTAPERNLIAANALGGMLLEGGGTQVLGNIIGLNAAGDTAFANTNGIVADSDVTHFIRSNVISGNSGSGVVFTLSGSAGSFIVNNYIGTNAAGTAAIANGANGIDLGTATGFNIGANAPGNENLISGNTLNGILVNAGPSFIGNNIIGLNIARSAAIPNNIGVNVQAGTGIMILENSIAGNTNLGIDLNNDGVTNNDANDADPGPNDLLNFPVVTSAVDNAGTINADFDLDAPAGSYRIEFFDNTVADGTGFGEGETLAGFVNITHTGSGVESFSTSFAGASGDILTATTTTCTDGTCTAWTSTSEFSQAVTALNRDIAHWPLNEVAGTNADEIINNIDGTYQNGVLLNQAGACGNTNTAVRFDGTDDYVEVPHNDIFLLNNGTVSFWFRPARIDLGMTMFSKDSFDRDTGGHIEIYMSSGGQLETRIQSTTAEIFISVPGVISADTWHHVAFTWGSGGMELFLDGVSIGTDPYTGGLGSTSGGIGNFEPIAFGASTAQSGDLVITPLDEPFEGYMDDVRMYSAVLSPAEIATAAGCSGAAPSLNGNVSEDINGDGNMADAQPSNAVAVELFLDDGDDTPDAGDVSQGTTTTDASGNYTFAGLAAGTYWVVVDSTTIPPFGGFNGGSVQADIWAEQTYGTLGAQCDNYTDGGITELAVNDTCFGGQNAEVSDNAAAITSAEHLSRIVVAATNANNVDFGFAFNVVSNSRDTDDDGANARFSQGSLRQLILNGNALTTNLSSNFEVPLNASDPGFNAANGGYISIQPASDLDFITDTITLDAYTQTGAIVNTQAYPGAFNGTLKVELNGVSATDDGFHIQADSSTVRGFAINNYGDDGIELQSDSNIIEGNYLGTDITGTVGAGNGIGIFLTDSDNNIIGGTTAAARNVISGNDESGGIQIDAGANNQIQGNFIGPSAAGLAGIGNALDGIYFFVAGSSDNLVGGAAATSGNLIAFNGADGVFLRNDSGSRNSIIGNSIHSNGTLGIDISEAAISDGVTENDAGDVDSGPNDLLNFPIITLAAANAGTININFDLDVPVGDYRIEFFDNTVADASGNGEGETFSGFVNINHTGSGVESFNTSFAGDTGDILTATTTECTDGTCTDWNSTSEFSDVFTALGPFGVSGNISEDVNGDGNMADGVAFDNVTVELFLDDGDNTPDAGDASQGTTTTDALGDYAFTGLSDTQTYWVVVDSKTLNAPAGYNVGDLTNIWGEQTYAVNGRCDNYIDSGQTQNAGAASCFGGLNAEVSDGYTAGVITSAEHIARVAVAGANVTGVDFGFAFNVISNSRDVDDDGANPRWGQGSLRQFILNSNAITTNLSSNFEVPLNASDPGFNAANGGYISIQPAAALDDITDQITLDGYTQTGAVTNSNPTPQALNTVLKIELNGVNAGAGSDGLRFTTADNNTVRGLAINRFGDDGIFIFTSPNNRGSFAGNFIGTDITGTVAQANGDDGIQMAAGSGQIGGTAAADRNLLSGNADEGLSIDVIADSVVVRGNYIGVNVNGNAALSNGDAGVFIGVGANNNQLGGTAANARNVISGNVLSGVVLGAGTNNTVSGNYIGTDLNGTAAITNGFSGIYIFNGATGNTIGGNVAGAGNLISGNTGSGIFIDAGANGHTVSGNLLGTVASGLAGLPNSEDGIRLVSNGNTVGGTTALERNVISGNTSDGIEINAANNNIIIGNYIGVGGDGATAIPNIDDGIGLTNGSTGNRIGGITAAEGNIIASNGDSGVVLAFTATTNNAVLGNTIVSNTNLGIDFLNDGVTANDADDIDIGPNTLLNFPAISSATESAGTISVNFDLDVPVGDYRIEFFDNTAADGTGFGEGETFAGFVNINHTGSGVESFSTSFAGVVGDILTATTTECTDATCTAWNSTSEFSQAVTTVAASTFSISGNVSEDVNGDSNMADAVAFNNVTVELFLDDGDNIPNAGDASQGTTTTGVTGNYSFTGLTNVQTYWVVVDSRSLNAPAGYNGVFTLADIWGEQTHATAGGQCDNYTNGGINEIAAADACFGGINAEVSDGYATGVITNAEHATRITLAGASVTNVNFGFAFNVVTNSRDVDDDGGNPRFSQGSLRQFILNGNAIVTNLSSNFEVPLNASDSGFNPANGGYISIQPASVLDDITDQITLDGYTQTGAVANTNATPQALNTVLKIELNGVGAGAGVDGLRFTTADNNIVRGLAINRFSDEGITALTSTNNRGSFVGNFIGTDITGGIAQANGGFGLAIFSGSAQIGSTIAADRNIISSNTGGGLRVTGAANGVTVAGNFIGVDLAGTAILGNGFGIQIDSAAVNTTVGGTAAGVANVISGNNNIAVLITGAGTSANTVAGNLIGTDRTGTVALANNGAGIRVDGGATGNTIGGTVAAARNIISGNTFNGINIQTGSSIVQGNWVGVTITGLAALPNGANGVAIVSSGNTIGGNTVNERNVISGNGGDGIEIDGGSGGGDNNIVTGNYIGVGSDGATAIPNVGGGVTLLNSADSNRIGGSTAAEANIIANNGDVGLSVTSAGSLNNAILRNSIFSNTSLGIDINSDGVTTNDAGDVDNGPNDLLNFPVIAAATESGGTVTVNFDLDVPAGNYRIEFFDNTAADGTGFGEGETFAGVVNINHTGSGVENFGTTFAGNTGDIITTTATECTDGTCTAWNSTSEFSQAFTAVNGNAAVSAVLAEIAPNTLNINSLANAFIYDVLPTINGGDTGVNQVVITAPAGYVGLNVNGVEVGAVPLTANCPAPAAGQFCANIAAQTITVALGTAVTTTLTNIRVLFDADAPAVSGVADFTSAIDDTGSAFVPQATAVGNADGDAGDANSQTVAVLGAAVSAVLAEIAPNTVAPGIAANSFTYDVLPTINPGNSGVDQLIVTAPAGYGSLNVTAVRIGGAAQLVNCPAPGAAEYCANVVGQDITVTLGSAVTATLTNIQIQFNADVPVALGSADFVSTVDDAATPFAAQATVPGDADSDAADANSQTVQVAGNAVTSVIAEIAPNIIAANTVANNFTYDLLPTINAGDSGVNQFTVTAPGGFSNFNVNAVTVGTVAQTSNCPAPAAGEYCATVSGQVITVTLGATVTGNLTPIQLQFDADAPAVPGVADFTTTVDDTTSSVVAQDATVGNADGDGSDDNSITVEVLESLIVLNITHTASKQEAVVGESIIYRVDIRNLDTDPVTPARIAIQLPPDFKYIDGSAMLNGVPIEISGSRILFADLGVVPGLVDSNGNGQADLGESGFFEFVYRVRVGSGAGVDQHDSIAYVISSCLTCEISNRSIASVDVILDLLLEQSTIIGKVFEDKNADGWQDRNEPGVAGAMVVLDNGTYAETDAYGRYHFPLVEPGQRLVKLNLMRLPGGSAFVANGRATRVVTVSPGLLSKVNYGVTYDYQVISIGRPAGYKLATDAETTALPTTVTGNVNASLVLVNGDLGNLPDHDLIFDDVRVDNVVEMDGDRLVKPIVLNFGSVAVEAMAGWRLNIYDGRNQLVKQYKDKGAPPPKIVWNGDLDTGRLQGGSIYFYQLNIQMPNNTEISSARRMFGVNRTSLLNLNLTGSAFEVGSDELTQRTKELLLLIAGKLSRYPDEKVLIAGHADSTGTRSFNLNLSERRANAAYEFLTSEGELPKDRFVITWHGEDQPIAGNSSNIGRELNRRVEINSEVVHHEKVNIFKESPQNLEQLASINGEEVPVDKAGNFSTEVPSNVKGLNIRMNNQFGEELETNVRLPNIEIVRPNGKMELVYGDRQPNYVVHIESSEKISDYEDQGIPVIDYELLGLTEADNTVLLDGETVLVDAEGQFKQRLPFKIGNNVIGLVIQNRQGYSRIANLNVAIKVRDDKDLLMTITPIPYLSIKLPPKGMLLSKANLLIPGKTDLGNSVTLNGKPVVLDENGRFVIRHEVSYGSSELNFEVTDPKGYTGEISQPLRRLKGNDLFLMAIADAKYETVKTKGYIVDNGITEAKRSYTEGRIAYYLKGYIKGKYLITSAFDSGQGEFSELFSDLDETDNDRLLTNLDPDVLYPVYGDESEVVYDVESQGKFYLAVQSDQVQAKIGNYPLNFTDTELAAYQRTLYGAQFNWRSKGETQSGQPTVEAKSFIANVKQTPIRDELRATGGSLYYLSQQDIIEGSEQVTLVVRDKDTGLVLSETRQLRNVDYTIHYDNGRLLFHSLISSTQSGGGIIENDLIAGHPVYLQVDYEAKLNTFEQTTQGARIKNQIMEGLSLGGSYIKDERISSQYELSGVDTEYVFGNSRVLGEFAQSKGSDAAIFSSDDGGLQYTNVSAVATEQGEAYKFAADLDVGEWFDRPDRLKIKSYVKQLEAGFVSNGNRLEQGTDRYGIGFEYGINEQQRLLGQFDHEELLNSLVEKDISQLQWQYKRETWRLLSEYQSQTNIDALANEQNRRTAAVQLEKDWTEKLSSTLTYQQSLEGPEDDQTRASVNYQVTDKLGAEATAVSGTQGDAVLWGLNYNFGGTRAYLNRTQTNEINQQYKNQTVLGTETQLTQNSTVYSEYQRNNISGENSDATVVGSRYKWHAIPSRLNFSFAGEYGEESGNTNNGDHYALGLGMQFNNLNGLKISSQQEIRKQRGSNFEQYLSKNSLGLKVGADYTLLAEYNFASTQGNQQQAADGEFDKVSVGLAYRPVKSDRFNLLTRYTTLTDEPTFFQSQNADLAQQEIEVLSAEWSYQINVRWEWAGKQAFKQLVEETVGFPTVETDTLLMVQRVNANFHSDYYLGLEYRLRKQKQTNDQADGFAAELLWQPLDNMRVGGGYSFTDVSDNEFADDNYSAQGLFFRVQGIY